MNTKFFSKNVIILVILSLIWGSSYILMKRGLTSFSAIQVSMLRIIFSFLTLLPILPRALKNLRKKDIPFIIIVGLIGSGIPSYLYPLAISHVDSGTSGIINSLTPVFVMFFGWLLFKVELHLIKLIGLFIALIGASALIFFKADEFHFDLNSYALFAVLATICYGFSSNVLKAKLSEVNSLELTSLSFAIIGPFAAIILFSTDFIGVLKTVPSAPMSLFYILLLGVFGTAGALVLFNYLIRATDALYASSVTFLMPLVALVWAYKDGEAMGLGHLLGLALILIGVYLTTRIETRKV